MISQTSPEHTEARGSPIIVSKNRSEGDVGDWSADNFSIGSADKRAALDK
jgi:hypothetical protein